MMQNIYDIPQITLDEEDFVRRKRAKNVVPFYDRCHAKEQTTSNVLVVKRTAAIFVEHIAKEHPMCGRYFDLLLEGQKTQLFGLKKYAELCII